MTLHEVLLASFPAAVTGLFGYLAARVQFRRKPAEDTDAISSAFSALVTQLRTENDRHMSRIDALREEAHTMRNQLAKLQAFAEALFKHIGVLEKLVLSLGGVVPARPVLPDAT